MNRFLWLVIISSIANVFFLAVGGFYFAAVANGLLAVLAIGHAVGLFEDRNG